MSDSAGSHLHPDLPPLVFGTMGRRELTPEHRIELFHRALNLGVTTFDTAPLYGFGEAERLLGKALREVPRSQVQVLTKVGLRWDAGQYGEVLFEHTTPDGDSMVVRRNARPESVTEEVHRSLERLDTDYLDLVQIHQYDPRTPLNETMSALNDLCDAGLIRGLGVSNFNAEQIGRAQGCSPWLGAVQQEFNLLRQHAATELLPLCIDRKLAFLSYSPLAAGQLVHRDKPAAAAEHSSAIATLLAQQVMPLAKRYDVAPVAVVLAWALGQQGVTSVICGASSERQLRQQLPAATVGLSEAEQHTLTAAFAKVQIVHPWERKGLLSRLKNRLSRMF